MRLATVAVIALSFGLGIAPLPLRAPAPAGSLETGTWAPTLTATAMAGIVATAPSAAQSGATSASIGGAKAGLSGVGVFFMNLLRIGAAALLVVIGLQALAMRRIMRTLIGPARFTDEGDVLASRHCDEVATWPVSPEPHVAPRAPSPLLAIRRLLGTFLGENSDGSGELRGSSDGDLQETVRQQTMDCVPLPVLAFDVSPILEGLAPDLAPDLSGNVPPGPSHSPPDMPEGGDAASSLPGDLLAQSAENCGALLLGEPARLVNAAAVTLLRGLGHECATEEEARQAAAEILFRDRPELTHRLFRALLARRPGFSFQIDVADGQGLRHFLVSATLPRAGSRPAVAVFTLTDITALQKSYERPHLDVKLDIASRLGGGIAHDFNNLFAIIIGNLELAEEDLEQNFRRVPSVANALKTARRATEITGRLQAFARRRPTGTETVDVNAMIRMVGGMISGVIPATINLRLALADSLHPVEVDPAELKDCLMNLALNGRDAIPSHGELVFTTSNTEITENWSVPGTALPPGRYVEISVSDSGSGIPKDVGDDIFAPFYSTRGSGGGAGLGLATVYGFVKRHGGLIEALPREGGGSVFRILLPRSTNPVAVDLPQPIVEPDGVISEHILVVEDETDLRKLVSQTLVREGYKVTAVANADTALRYLAQSGEIDLVFTDIAMPGSVDGLQLASEIRRTRPGTPVLVTTGFAGAPVAPLSGAADPAPQSTPDAKAVSIIQKPYSRDALLRFVRTALDADNAPGA